MLRKIKGILKNSYLTKKGYKKLSKIYQRYKKANYNNLVQGKGPNILIELEKILEQTECEFFFDMGTLLGIIREGKLIDFDADIDIGIILRNPQIILDVRKAMVSNGAIYTRKYIVDNIGETINSFKYKGIDIDICYYFETSQDLIGYLFYDPENKYETDILHVVRTKCSLIQQIDKFEFNNYHINVPQMKEKYLSERYGKNWMIPDKNYVYWKANSTTPIENKGFVYNQNQ